MADEDVEFRIDVESGDSVAELESIRDASRDAGEELDRLDGESAKVSIEVDSEPAEQGLDRVREASDGARDSIGNTSGEGAAQLAELAGASGPVSEGLAQVAEQALSGQLSLKGLALAGGALAGLQLIMVGLEYSAKKTAEQIAAVGEATEDLSAVADAEVIETLGRAMVNATLTGKPLDDLFKQMAEENLPGFRRALDLAGSSSQVTEETLRLMRAALADVESEMAQQEETTRKYGDAIDSVDPEGLADELPSLVEPLGIVESAMAGAAEGVGALDAELAKLLGRINDQQAWLNAKDAVENYVIALSNGEATTREQERAFLSAQEALLRYVEGLEGVPAEVKSQVIAEVNAGDIGAAYAILDELTRTRTVTVNIATGTVSGALAGVLAGITPTATPAAGGGPVRYSSAGVVNNYYPPQINPTELTRATTEYGRVQGGG